MGALLAGLLPAIALADVGPTATDDDAFVPVNAAATTIDVLGNDVGTGLTIESAGSAGHGTVGVAGDALSLTYTPDTDYHGPDTFDYTVTDGALTDVGTVTVTVGVDAVDDPEGIVEDQLPSPVSFDVLSNDTFPGGSTITAVTQGTLGDVTIAPDGLSVSYAPHADANGTDTFTYTLDDGSGSTDTATVTVTVTSVNDAPDGADKTVGTTVDTPYVFAASDFGFSDAHDTPPDALSAVTIATLPAAGVLDDNGTPVLAGDSIPVADITGGDLQFTPGAGEHGLGYASFTFQVQDDGGTADSGDRSGPDAEHDDGRRHGAEPRAGRRPRLPDGRTQRTRDRRGRAGQRHGRRSRHPDRHRQDGWGQGLGRHHRWGHRPDLPAGHRRDGLRQLHLHGLRRARRDRYRQRVGHDQRHQHGAGGRS